MPGADSIRVDSVNPKQRRCQLAFASLSRPSRRAWSVRWSAVTDSDFVRRTRDSYDAIAVDYTEWVGDELALKPVDRGILDMFAELVLAADANAKAEAESSGSGSGSESSGTVADIGCGPGRVSAYLAGRGLSMSGIDLSPKMVEIANSMYPELSFRAGSMLALDIPDSTLAGIIAWYSIIHVPTDQLPVVFAEFRRVLAPGGYLQLAFQVGDEMSHRSDALGHNISLDFHRRQPARIVELLTAAGFRMYVTTVREPEETKVYAEPTQQAFLLARAPENQD